MAIALALLFGQKGGETFQHPDLTAKKRSCLVVFVVHNAFPPLGKLSRLGLCYRPLAVGKWSGRFQWLHGFVVY
jgi:hypothetical protein